jgi:hypothetical protein
MKQINISRYFLCVATIMVLWSGSALSADWPKQGTTSYVTHFMVHPTTTIDVGGPGKAIALEMVGTTANLSGETLMDKMTAQCVAIQIVSKAKNYIDGGCVLTDKDGDKVFSTFDTREIVLSFEGGKFDGSIPNFTCGTHIIVGGTGKYKGMSGKEPFNCTVLPTAAGDGWAGMDIEHQLIYEFE